MANKGRFLLIIVIVIVTVGFIVGYIIWNKPQRNVENEQAIQVTSVQLVKDFQADEAAANNKYLDKAIQVTGAIRELKQNQDGDATLTLASDDAFTGVFCTLKDAPPSSVLPGNTVVVKGICSGMLSDVRLREAVIVR